MVIGSGPERARLEALAGPTVSFLGWQPDEVIRDHYRRCQALLFPGVEDFGIVPIEALACGSPVIALNQGGVAETVDDRVGRVYDDPTDAGLLAAIAAWEAAGAPHDPAEARRRAEGLGLPVFRRRLLDFLADVVAEPTVAPSTPTRDRPRPGIPAPHVAPAPAASSPAPVVRP